MALASPVVGSRRSLALPRDEDAATRTIDLDGARVRDELTRDRLEVAVGHLPRLQVLGFDADWWDGQSHVPCLVVRGGRRGRRLRVVETSGACVVVPFARRTAERWLAARRRPRRPELGIVSQHRPDDIVVDATTDTVRCSTARCGVLLPVGGSSACPGCGGQDRPRSAKEYAAR
jgi:hypothetical protein